MDFLVKSQDQHSDGPIFSSKMLNFDRTVYTATEWEAKISANTPEDYVDLATSHDDLIRLGCKLFPNIDPEITPEALRNCGPKNILFW